MTSEMNLLISILKLTRTGPTAEKLISRDAGIARQVADDILMELCQRGLIQCRDRIVEVSSNQRLNIAIHAIKLGVDLERVCKFLEWIEFENIAAEAFEANSFYVKRRFRFKRSGRRWEIDVLACREPLIVCTDCKHWHHGWVRSAISKAVEAQVERTQALARTSSLSYEKKGLVGWRRAVLVPVVLSLVSGPLKFYKNTPIVPVLQLQNFIDELHAHLEMLTHFTVDLK